jgi:hypothetical protein
MTSIVRRDTQESYTEYLQFRIVAGRANPFVRCHPDDPRIS